jgi:hypothetical protein
MVNKQYKYLHEIPMGMKYPKNGREAVLFCLDNLDYLNDKQQAFINNIAQFPRLTEKQTTFLTNCVSSIKTCLRVI